MNSLMGYGSDDDPDDSPDTRQVDSYSSSRTYRKASGNHHQDDTNYDEVQMSLSEDSDGEPKHQPKSSRERDDGHRGSPKSRDDRDDRTKERRDERRDNRDRYGSRDKSEEKARYNRDDDKPKYREDKEEDRGKSSRDDDRTRDRGDRFKEREDDKVRERRDDRRGKSRERYSSRDDRYRKDRDRRRSRSPRDGRDRERRRSKSPRRNERSRSRSRDRNTNRGRGGGGFSRRFNRGQNRMDHSDKMAGGSVKSEENSTGADASNKDRFFVPGITGRFREQIEKRKLLWQKKEPEKQETVVKAAPSFGTGGSRTTKVWEATTFAQDTDGKVANKFKRLMGIRSATDGNNSAVEVLKKQEEMFTSMEQQYEVARTATHTMRGVGLGFGSYPR